MKTLHHSTSAAGAKRRRLDKSASFHSSFTEHSAENKDSKAPQGNSVNRDKL